MEFKTYQEPSTSNCDLECSKIESTMETEKYAKYYIEKFVKTVLKKFSALYEREQLEKAQKEQEERSRAQQLRTSRAQSDHTYAAAWKSPPTAEFFPFQNRAESSAYKPSPVGARKSTAPAPPRSFTQLAVESNASAHKLTRLNQARQRFSSILLERRSGVNAENRLPKLIIKREKVKEESAVTVRASEADSTLGPWIRHPLSMGYDYRQVRAAFFRPHLLKQVSVP